MQNKEKDEEIFGPRSLMKNAQCIVYVRNLRTLRTFEKAH